MRDERDLRDVGMIWLDQDWKRASVTDMAQREHLLHPTREPAD